MDIKTSNVQKKAEYALEKMNLKEVVEFTEGLLVLLNDYAPGHNYRVGSGSVSDESSTQHHYTISEKVSHIQTLEISTLTLDGSEKKAKIMIDYSTVPGNIGTIIHGYVALCSELIKVKYQ